MKVSVIIPTYNEADHISACLQSLQKQTLHDREIIIVDDGSTDQTVKLVKRHRGLKLYRQQHKGPAIARNRGAKHAKGDILVFVDADMTFNKKFLFQLVKPIDEGKTSGTFTTQEIVSNWDQPWAQYWNRETTGSTTRKRLPDNYPSKSPVFRAIRQSEFNRVGGFDAIGYTDDWTLSRKLGYVADAAPGAIMYHYNPASPTQVYTQAKWIGRRRYKLGEIGRLIALMRSSLPFSLILGVSRAITRKQPAYLAFKLVYDFGISMGILSYWIKRQHAQ